MYKFEKARTFAVVMAILFYVIAKVFCCMVIGTDGIMLPVIIVFFQEVKYEEFTVLAALIFLCFAIVFAFIAYICHQLSKAEYKWK